MVIADASVMIALAKIGRLKLLMDLYNQVVIGPLVMKEVVDRGRAIGAAEVAYVEKALQEQWVRIARPSTKENRFAQKLLSITNLDEGEAESLALASSRQVTLLVDDKEARTVAHATGLRHLGTAGVLLKAFMKGRVTYDELESAVRDLSRTIWLSPDVVAEILKRRRR